VPAYRKGQTADGTPDRARDCGLAVKVANTSGEAWRFTHRKPKTDRDDALRLAEREALGQPFLEWYRAQVFRGWPRS
jgi:hypothetical protein